MKQIFWILCVWVIIAGSCDPCHDCGEPLLYDPTVKVVFINRDTAIALQDTINANKVIVTSYSSQKKTNTSSITILKDSIKTLDVLIQNGQSDYVSIRTALQSKSDSLTTANDSLTSWTSKLNKANTALNKILTNVNNGLLLVSKAEILENGATITYEDSAKAYGLPLLLYDENSGQTSYQLEIADQLYEIAFSYDLYVTVDGARRVFKGALNLDTISHSFDSLIVTCRTSECKSNETTITAYF